MGRIRGKSVRQFTLDILKSHRGAFTDDYDANKAALGEIIETDKTVRNKIAGYITKLGKAKKIEEFIIEHST